jgi:hypothetical protein
MGCNKSGGQLMNNRILIPKTGSMEILDVNNLVYEKRIYRPSENDGLGIYVSQDGTIMVTASKNAAYRWTLSTPFDIATRTLEHSASMPYTSIYSIGFSPDGLHFFIGARDSMNYYMVIENQLSVPFDISGVHDWSYSYSIYGREYFMFSSDGSKIYTYRDSSPYDIKQYTLPTAYSLSGASLEKSVSHINGQKGLTMAANGMRFYHGNTTGSLTQYDLSIENDVGSKMTGDSNGTGSYFTNVCIKEMARKVYTAHMTSSYSILKQWTY